MNIRHFFDNADEKTIDRITEKYPPLSSADKERLYAMSKKKYNKEKTENKGNYIEVSGVERYRKPVWQKIASFAAVAVVAVSVVGGGIALTRGGSDTDISESISEQLDGNEYEAVARKLTDEFFELKNIISSRGAAYDENDTLTYKIGIFDDTIENPEIYDRIFYKVTDERFKCSQDIYDALRNITTTYYLPEESYINADLPWDTYSVPVEADSISVPFFAYLGTDVSEFESGSSVDRSLFANKMFDESYEPVAFDLEDDNDWESPYCIWVSDYVEHSGSLYMLTPNSEINPSEINPVGIVYEYNDTIEITDVIENGFTAVRYADILPNQNIIKRSEFKFLYIDGEWLIDKFSESVIDTEGVGSEETDFNAIAQQLTDKVLEFEKILYDADIEYDENDSITFYAYNSADPEWETLHGGEIKYCRVTDERFNSCQDIYTSIRSFTSFKFNPKDDYRNGLWIDESSIVSWLGNDLSEYEIGTRFDCGEERLPYYITYNGQLYVQPINTHDFVSREYTSDVSVGVAGEDRFTATREKTKYFSTETQCEEIHFDFIIEAGKWKVKRVYATYEHDEEDFVDWEALEEYESNVVEDYTAIATELTDKLLELENIICYGDVSYDENDMTVIDIVCSDDSAQFEEPYEAIFYKVTDPRFTCRRDLYDELRSIYTKQRYDEDDFSTATIFGYDLNFYLGSELSDYIVDGSMDIAENFDDDYEHINFAVYDDINGELYVRQCDFELAEYTSDVIIEFESSERILVKRKYKSAETACEEKIRNVVLVFEDDEWKIDYVFNTEVEMLENDE